MCYNAPPQSVPQALLLEDKLLVSLFLWEPLEAGLQPEGHAALWAGGLSARGIHPPNNLTATDSKGSEPTRKKEGKRKDAKK